MPDPLSTTPGPSGVRTSETVEAKTCATTLLDAL